MHVTPANANVTVSTWDTATLLYRYPEWPALRREERFQLLRTDAATRLATTRQSHNVATDGLLDALPRVLSTEHPTPDVGVRQMAIGADNSGFDRRHNSLNDEFKRFPVTDVAVDAPEILISTFIDSTQANGRTIREVGLIGGPPNQRRLLNHAPVDPAVDKSPSKTLILDVLLTFQE